MPRSLSEIAGEYFGRSWPRVLLTFLLVLAAPILLFRDRIRFEPSHFVEEWLKIGIGGLVLLVVLEAMNIQRTDRTSEKEEERFCDQTLLFPLYKVENQLLGFVRAHAVGQQIPVPDIAKAWSDLIKLAELIPLAPTPRAAEKLATSLAALKTERSQQIVATLSAANSIDDIDKSEYEELLANVRLAQSVAKTERTID